MSRMKTFRRDRLRRLAEQGRLELAGSYSFDDQYGADRQTGASMPVAFQATRDWRTQAPGVCYVFPDMFTGKPGHAWENDDGTVHLHIHSNHSLTFRILHAGA